MPDDARTAEEFAAAGWSGHPLVDRAAAIQAGTWTPDDEQAFRERLEAQQADPVEADDPAELRRRLGQPRIRGACANHPDKPGSYLWPDGTWRCDPCTELPRVKRWGVALVGHPCPECGEWIREDERVAIVDTYPPLTVCEGCIDV